MSRRSIVPVLVFLLASTATAGAARTGEIEVRDGSSGVPCFTVPEREERRGGAPNFQSIVVVEAGRANAVMWKMAMPATRSFPVSFRMCIPYAGRLPVLPQTPAAPLRPGRSYEVTIAAEPATRGGPRSYRARFCVSGEAGALKVGGTAGTGRGCGR